MSRCVAKAIKVPESVYAEAERLAERYDYSRKEAVRHMCREGGFDV